MELLIKCARVPESQNNGVGNSTTFSFLTCRWGLDSRNPEQRGGGTFRFDLAPHVPAAFCDCNCSAQPEQRGGEHEWSYVPHVPTAFCAWCLGLYHSNPEQRGGGFIRPDLTPHVPTAFCRLNCTDQPEQRGGEHDWAYVPHVPSAFCARCRSHSSSNQEQRGGGSFSLDTTPHVPTEFLEWEIITVWQCCRYGCGPARLVRMALRATLYSQYMSLAYCDWLWCGEGGNLLQQGASFIQFSMASNMLPVSYGGICTYQPEQRGGELDWLCVPHVPSAFCAWCQLWRNSNAEQRGGGSFGLDLTPHVPTEFCAGQLPQLRQSFGRVQAPASFVWTIFLQACCSQPLISTKSERNSGQGICSSHDVAGFFQTYSRQSKRLRLLPYWRGFCSPCSGSFQIGVELPDNLHHLCQVPLPGAYFLRTPDKFYVPICEGMPFQSTGSFHFLHRQSVLLVGRAVTSRSRWVRKILVRQGFSIVQANLGLATDVGDARYDMDVPPFGISDFISILRMDLYDGTLKAMHGLWGQMDAFFRTLLIVTLGYAVKLLSYATGLRGGHCNADNLVRCSRALTICIPFQLGQPVVGFSVGLSEQPSGGTKLVRPKPLGKQRLRRQGFSEALWLFFLLLYCMCTGVSAGSSSQYHVDNTGFRAARRSRKLATSVYNIRTACRNLDSPDTPDDQPGDVPPTDPPPDGEEDWGFTTENCLFQFFSFGCLPSYMVCAFFPGISLQEAIEQITIDAILPLHDEAGTYIPARGVPFRDSFALLWMPEWLLSSQNCLLFVDATLLGRYPFVMQYIGPAVSYAALAEQLRPLWEEELDHVYAFVPFFSPEPMQEDTQFPAIHGLTVVLQRDAFAPACIPEPDEAFRQYKFWGRNVDNIDHPPADLQWPVEKMQMTVERETGLYSIGSLDPTLPTVCNLARRFIVASETLHVQLAKCVPPRHVWYGEPGSQLAAATTRILPTGMICVFLILKGIGRESRAAWLSQDQLTRTDVLDALALDIPVIPGFKIRITGGAGGRERIVCRPGDVLYFNFVSDDWEPEESESDSDPVSDSELQGSDDEDPQYPPSDDCEAEAAGTTSGSQHSARFTVREQQWRQSHASEGTDHSVLADMWNLDILSSSAKQPGNRGDTSASHADCHVPARAAIHGKGIVKLPRYKGGRRIAGMTSGIRLYMAGMALMQCLMPGESVLLPLVEDVSSHGNIPADSLPSASCTSQYDIDLKQGTRFRQKGPSAGVNLWGIDILRWQTVDPATETDHGPLVTLLDQAKDSAFYSLCENLAWFMSAPENFPATGHAEDDGITCGCVHSPMSVVQCTVTTGAPLACQMSQLAGSTGQPGSRSDMSGKVVLDLQRAVLPPQREHDSRPSRLSCGVDRDMLELLLEGHKLDQLRRDIRPTPNMHENAQVALQHTPFWDGQSEFCRVAVYTDGSFAIGHDVVAYAVIVLLQVKEQWQIAGFMSGALETADPTINVQANAHVAELCGMIHARLINIAVGSGVQFEICYDCMSACQVMCLGSPRGSPIDNLAASIDALCFHQGIQSAWSHVAGHSGHPWNEVVDFLARHQLHAAINGHVIPSDLVKSLLTEGYMAWLWMAVAAEASPACWPSLNADGSFSSATSAQRSSVKHESPQQGSKCQHIFHIKAVTYNTLTLQAAGQVECLEQHFGNNGCCILGLQECRQRLGGVEHGSHFVKFASPALNRQGGCQIWLSKTAHPGVDSDGNVLKWRIDTFVTHHSDHRCLAVSGMAGSVRFGIIAAHAHTASSSKSDIQAFWKKLSNVKLPEISVKIILADANSSFDPTCWGNIYYRPLDDNAQEMVSFQCKTGMTPSDLWDQWGNEVKTWRSPSGFEKALDYVFVPKDMARHLRTLGVDEELLDLYADIDHKPLVVDFTFALVAKNTSCKKANFNVKAMSSAAGQQKLRDIFRRAPEIPWNMHACDHWEQLQEYLLTECEAAFPVLTKGPRKTYISAQLWDLIVLQRHIRGQLRCCKQIFRKELMSACLHIWHFTSGAHDGHGHAQDRLIHRFRSKRYRHNRYVAASWHRLTSLRSDIRQLMKQCQADRAHQAFRDAQEEGPGAVARLMTALLRSGRRYRPPQTMPPLKDGQGNLLTEEADVFRVLGQHFAKAEKAVQVESQAYRGLIDSNQVHAAADLDGSLVPCVADLSSALRRAKAGKAPGASGLRPEIFKSASTPAAVVLYPLMLKQLMRGEVPTAFLRSQICPIPKPGKCPNNAEGWRSIALQEIPHKAVCSTMRRFLLQALDHIALPLQLGGRPGGPMLVPSLHVVAHLRRLRRIKQSSGVLYIDGVQAFYSVIREIVVGADETEAGASRIVSIIEEMHSDELVREDLFKLLCGPSILEQAGAPRFVQDFLRTGFRGSHFQMGRGSDNIYLTQAGTIPGSPLADIVFQLALVRFHRNLQYRLRAKGLLVCVNYPSSSDCESDDELVEASTSTWVDDLAVVVASPTAAGLIPKMAQVAAAVEQSLGSTGVRVNYAPGKTAAMYCLRGRGANAVRKFWALEQQGRVQLPSGPGQGKFLQLTLEYTHLGSRLQSSGQQTAAIAHRVSIAQPIFSALRKRLLFNDCLSCKERVRLVVQGPLASLLHGSGLWVTTDRGTAHRAHEAISNMYRQCIRPILGLSSRGLTSDEVCCALNVLAPSDVLKFQRLRAVLSIAPLADKYLVAVLVQERSWIELVVSDWTSFRELACPVELSCRPLQCVRVLAFFAWVSDHTASLRLKIKSLIQRELQHLAEQSDQVIRKAKLLDGVFSQHAISWRQPDIQHAGLPSLACPECHKVVHGFAALASHRSKVHRILALGSLLHDHTICPVCLIEFWSPSRLWEHLRKSAQCRYTFEASDPDLIQTCKSLGKACSLPAARVEGPKEWWATLQPVVDTERLQPSRGDAQARVMHAWSAFSVSFSSAADASAQAELIHVLWREILWALQVCDGIVDTSISSFRSAQQELDKVLKACQGLSVYFRGLYFTSFSGHLWILPVQAKRHLERLVAFSLHDEFISQRSP